MVSYREKFPQYAPLLIEKRVDFVTDSIHACMHTYIHADGRTDKYIDE